MCDSNDSNTRTSTTTSNSNTTIISSGNTQSGLPERLQGHHTDIYCKTNT